jgi:hypothetical protein
MATRIVPVDSDFFPARCTMTQVLMLCADGPPQNHLVTIDYAEDVRDGSWIQVGRKPLAVYYYRAVEVERQECYGEFIYAIPEALHVGAREERTPDLTASAKCD